MQGARARVLWHGYEYEALAAEFERYAFLRGGAAEAEATMLLMRMLSLSKQPLARQ